MIVRQRSTNRGACTAITGLLPSEENPQITSPRKTTIHRTLTLYKTAGIDGLLIEGNEIKVKGSSAIYVNADRNSGRFPVKRVQILKNKVSGGGILLSGDPSEKCVVKGNKFLGVGKGVLELRATADVADNEGMEIKKG